MTAFATVESQSDTSFSNEEVEFATNSDIYQKMWQGLQAYFEQE